MSDDLISRQAAINALEELKELDYELYIRTSYSHLMEDQWDFVIKRYKEAIKETPCAQPKTAYWIDVSGDVPIYNAGGFTEKRKIGVKCSNCQRLNTWCEFDYCPHCGAKMKGETE